MRQVFFQTDSEYLRNVAHEWNLFGKEEEIMIYRRVFGMPGWGFRSSFDELDRIRRQFDRMLEGWSETGARASRAGVFPLVNLTEDREKYYVRAELPGLDAADLDIQATGNTLSISGERKIPTEEGNVRYHRREREAGRFSRMIAMPGDIDPEKIEASLADGILTVVVAKAEKAKPRQITVQ
jgi:HSP20 family protein